MMRFINNRRGQAHGYSGCHICGDSWSWKTGYYIPVSDSGSIFPFCDECNKTASNEQKHEAINSLKQMWLRFPQNYGPAEEKMIKKAHEYIDREEIQ